MLQTALRSAGAIALWITIVVGALTIAERLWRLAMSLCNAVREIIARREEERVFRFIRDTKSQSSLYGVKEIAGALNRSPQQVMKSLRRLELSLKVYPYDRDESTGGQWGLHDLESRKSE